MQVVRLRGRTAHSVWMTMRLVAKPNMESYKISNVTDARNNSEDIELRTTNSCDCT